MSGGLHRVEHAMGLPISLDVPRASPAVEAAVCEAFAWLHEVDRRFSPFREDSEVCRLDRGEIRPGEPSPELVEILTLCGEYKRRSGGAFQAWLPGRRFDPCGIVKGWAVQRAARMLRDAGASRFCLNAGGDVVAFASSCASAGDPHDSDVHGKPWRVGIRHPDQPHDVCAVINVWDRAVATSGTYERGAHIIDGRTGRAVLDLVSLTVVAADLVTADAVSTAAFAMGREGVEWAACQPQCLVFAIDADRRVHRSPELELVTSGREAIS